jgi:hypothetical protein
MSFFYAQNAMIQSQAGIYKNKYTWLARVCLFLHIPIWRISDNSKARSGFEKAWLSVIVEKVNNEKHAEVE